MNLIELGARIRGRREKQGLRQSDIASALRLSAQAVSKWERGENAPDIAVLVGLARLLDVRCEWLLGGGPAEEETFGAVVFATGLRGFAARAASSAPAALAAWSNTIHFGVTEAVTRHEGVPVKYVGDGALSFFTGVDMEARALAAARGAMSAVASEDLTIALHAGEIYLGRIGHPDYAALDILGAAVNTAFLMLPRVDQSCASRIGVSAPVIERLPETLTARGALDLTGGSLPIFEG